MSCYSIYKRVKETMVNAFWDILREELQEDPPIYTQGLVLLSDVKEVRIVVEKLMHVKLTYSDNIHT